MRVEEIESGQDLFLSKMVQLESPAVDLIWLSPRVMAHSMVAKRALWLKYWTADSVSKQEMISSLC